MAVELWWLGQAGFRLRDAAGGPRVFVDPYLVARPDRAWQAPISPEALGHEADVVLCTHEHRDHLDRPSLQTAAAVDGARFHLVIPEPLRDEALALGIPAERVHAVQPDQPITIVPGVEVTPVPARHGVDVADAYSFGESLSNGKVRYLGYVLELGGVRIYHAGDCIPYVGQVELLRALEPDLALLPINGRDFFRETDRNLVGNMDPREAARLAADIGASALVPMHWELFPHNRGFTGDLATYIADRFPELSLLVMGRGARVVWGAPSGRP